MRVLRRVRVWLGVVPATLAVIALGAYLARRPSAPAGVIVVSGRVEGDQAAVGAKTGGALVRVAVHEGQRLQAGALIAQLGSDQARAELGRAEHLAHLAREEVGAARAQVAAREREVGVAQAALVLAREDSRTRIGEAEAALGAAKAGLGEALATAERAGKDHRRVAALYARQLVAAQAQDEARAAAAVAAARVEAARDEARRAEETLNGARASRLAIVVKEQEEAAARERTAQARAGVEAARASVQTADAAVAAARAVVADLQVTAPFAGTVLRRLVQPGEVVAAGTPLVTLVDLSRLHARVYVAERDLSRVRVGAAARVYADGVPGRAFEATVSEVAQQAEFTPRDVHMSDERASLVFAVKLALADPAGLLKPGMPVDARIRLAEGAPWDDGRP